MPGIDPEVVVPLRILAIVLLVEVLPQPREKVEEMPEVISAYIRGIDNPSIRKFVEVELHKQRGQGRSWASIQTEIMKPKEEEPADATVGS